MTPIETLHHRAETSPKSIAFSKGQDVWTYERLAVEAERLAYGLAGYGIRKGDRIALHMVNRPELIIAYYACFQMGAIAVPLASGFRAAELGPLLRLLQPSLYIGEVNLYRNVAAIDLSVIALNRRFIVDRPVKSFGASPWTGLLADMAGEPVLADPETYAPAVLLNMAGTTDPPKFIIHTAQTLAGAADSYEHWVFDGDQVKPLALPLVHASGLFSMLAHIQLRAPFVLFERFDAETGRNLIKRQSRDNV
jgi:long-chain acyl-CoA synthetase